MDIKELSNNHRCFRIFKGNGSFDSYFFLGAYHEVGGVRKYGICKMVSKPTKDDIANIDESTFLSLYNEGKLELL